MGNISFVILNYKTDYEAEACAESILKTQGWPDIRVAIVDNGSANGSAARLKEHFAAEERVHIVLSEENLGFARGNNLGIRYVREHFHPEFIVVANSDIIFTQADYCERLAGIYGRRPYAILGGDIVDASGTQHFNPVAIGRRYTLNYMRKQVLTSWLKAMAFRAAKLFHLQGMVAAHYGEAQPQEAEDGRTARQGAEDVVPGAGPGARDVEATARKGAMPHGQAGEGRAVGTKGLATREVGGESVAADCRVGEEMEGVLLHGCCLVFSEDFFRVFEGFYDETFLYAEEEILYYLAMKEGLTVLYSPEISCMHKEASTTKAVNRDFCDAKLFYFSHITRSYRQFLRLMKGK